MRRFYDNSVDRDANQAGADAVNFAALMTWPTWRCVCSAM
jgi:hypothetical protein